jgi:23S rRNA (guanosine2251-2'-O)-methyltransferase
MKENNASYGENIVAGRNSVAELMRSGRAVDKIVVLRGKPAGGLSAILAQAAERGIPIKEVAPEKLDAMCPGANHQGIAAVAAAKEYSTVDDILSLADERGEPPFIIICDEIEDPHNLGAIIRTAECCGAHGVIVPKRRSAGLGFAVAKAACGALEYMPVARITNLAAAIDELKKKGVWVYGADMDGSDYTKQDFSGPAALCIGSEGNGMGRLIREKCDVIVSLPMKGKITSLNASVAAGILMYQIARFR